ncbi:MAG TPA: ATP-dependent zinc metalloprotease FtsH [Vicinamibacteria bacterium]|nr:ATP-dependent zinc metalloprotease FtsH [Vicinamibacteria bacterium]
MDGRKGARTQFSIAYVLLALSLVFLVQGLVARWLGRAQEVPYSQFRDDLANGRIAMVTFEEQRIVYTLRETSEGESVDGNFTTVRVDDPELVQRLLEAGIEFQAEPPPSGIVTALMTWVLPLIPLALIWYFVFRRMGSSGPLSIGKSRAKEIAPERTKVTFEDVGGVDEVETELKEVIEFLKDPSRFTAIGAKLPTGILLVGPPGTGKTLLARATAGEAGVPFFSMSGSEFVELFVGVGASRVRDLFEQAKTRAPCIIFIDEIDAIGQSRSPVAAMRTNDEREQTLNQLLYEMDGFESNQGVVIMGATNRPEILDKALLRAGRFDRQIEVPLPTEIGRRQILDIHTENVPLGPDVDLDRLAQITAGFSGADLENLVNEAALMAVRRSDAKVGKQDFDLAIERIVAGLQRDTPLKGETRRRVAYHEGGHALVSQLLPNTDQVHRVSIIPTSKGALGYTMEMPVEDRYLMSEAALKERLAVMLGGRAAEILIFSEISTGAANDLERATALARRMVTEFGMSEALGPVRYAAGSGSGYLGRELGLESDLSPETASLIDKEVRRIIEAAQDQALELLREHRAALDTIATVLQEREAIEGAEVGRIVSETAST